MDIWIRIPILHYTLYLICQYFIIGLPACLSVQSEKVLVNNHQVHHHLLQHMVVLDVPHNAVVVQIHAGMVV